MVLCERCNDTGIEDTGNNALPCGCVASLKVKFNVAGIKGVVTGEELMRHLLNTSPEPLTHEEFNARRAHKKAHKSGKR